MVLQEQPPGVRSTQRGGTWEYARNANGTQRFVTSWESFRGRLQSDHLRASLWAEVRTKMRCATRGQLQFGAAPADVDQMRATDDVLELRFAKTWEVKDGERMLLRLFFSEPAALPEALVAIQFFCKIPADQGALQEQTQAAKAASLLLAEYANRGFHQ